MNMINALFLLLGSFTIFLILKLTKRKQPCRKGIIHMPFTDTIRNKEFNCQIEVKEIGHTDSKSKIKVLNISFSGSESKNYYSEIKSILDKSWFDSCNIDWEIK